jgi:predicted amidohydrolase
MGALHRMGLDSLMMGDFTIAAAQIRSVRGDVSRNLAAHADAVAAAASHKVSALVFPELSLTGYEPDLAASLAFAVDDARVSALGRLAVDHRIALTVGAPIRTGAGKPAIGAFILTPDGNIRTYLKMHLGKSEVAYFSHGERPFTLDVDGCRLGISICADSSRESHARTYRDLGAQIYAAGVFLTREWYGEDAPRLQRYAAEFGLLAVMANQGASSGTHESIGKSAVWAPGGDLLVQADGAENVLVTATLTSTGWQGNLVRL